MKTSEQEKAEEHTYRRGFDQGAYAMMMGFFHKIPYEEMHAWKAKIRLWRWDKKRTKIFPPKAPWESPPEVMVTGEALSKPVYWTGQQWAVTSYGIECRNGTYAIEKKRLWEENNGHGWHQQIEEKEWANIHDFDEALEFARDKFKALKP